MGFSIGFIVQICDFCESLFDLSVAWYHDSKDMDDNLVRKSQVMTLTAHISVNLSGDASTTPCHLN
jgi:hypothetical protein